MESRQEKTRQKMSRLEGDMKKHLINKNENISVLNDNDIVPQGCPRPGSRTFKSDKKCIKQCSFKHNPNGIVLTEPGHYKLHGDVKFSPTQIGAAAITIASSNVCLDLRGYTLSQTNNTQQVYGIYVCRDVERIEITGKKGKARILDFTMDGVRVLGRTSYVTIENLIVTQTNTVEWPVVEDFDARTFYLVSGIVIGEGDVAGLDMIDTFSSNIVNYLTVKNVICTKHNFGLRMCKVYNYLTEDSSFCENSFVGANFGAMNFIIKDDDPQTLDEPYTKNGIIQRCYFDRNVVSSGDVYGDFTICGGSSLNRGYNIQYLNNTMNENTTNVFSMDCSGMDNDAVRNSVYKNCEAHRNRALGGFGYCDGIHFSGSFGNFRPNKAITIDNCHFSENNSYDGVWTTGLTLVWVQDATVTNCSSYRNTGDIDTVLISGLLVGGPFVPGSGPSRNIVIENFHSSNHTGDQVTRSAGGFYVSNGSENIQFKECVSQYNLNHGFYIGDFSGNTPHLNILIDNCQTSDNGNNGERDSGFIIDANPSIDFNLNGCVIQNCTSHGNYGDGFTLLEGQGSYENVIFKNNEADNNLNVGFRVPDSETLVTKNLSYNNGTNYVGIPVANIVSGTSAALPSDPLSLLNFDITKA